MADFTFHFNLSFRRWLREGLADLSAGAERAEVDTRTFQSEVADGNFNGVDLSLEQVRFLTTLFKVHLYFFALVALKFKARSTRGAQGPQISL